MMIPAGLLSQNSPAASQEYSKLSNKCERDLTLRSSLEYDRVGVPAAVVEPGGHVGPGVARHLLTLDLQ